MKKKYKTGLITDISQLPQGYVAMSELKRGVDESEKRIMSDAHLEGHVRAFKLMKTPDDIRGQVYLHVQDYEEWKMSRETKPSRKGNSNANDNTAALERIALAVEKTNELITELCKIWKA